MPCNLTARADARIDNKVLAKMLNAQNVEQIIRQFAQAANLVVDDVSAGTTYAYAYLKNGMQIEVNWRNGAIGIDVGATTRNTDPEQVSKIAAGLKAYFAQVTGLMLQSQVVNALKQNFTVEQTQRAANGSLVVTIGS